MKLIIALYLCLVQYSLCQRSGVMADPDRESRDLFRRISSSSFVAVGKITKSKAVTRRMTPEDLARWRESNDLGNSPRVVLYTFEIEEALCEPSYLGVADASTVRVEVGKRFAPGKEIVIFQQGVPATDSDEETYLKGKRYLMFFQAMPRQMIPAATYELDTEITYYRAFEREAGLIRLDGDGSLVLKRTKRLCEALGASQVEMKLNLLEAIKYSGDPLLAESADAAITVLRSKYYGK